MSRCAAAIAASPRRHCSPPGLRTRRPGKMLSRPRLARSLRSKPDWTNDALFGLTPVTISYSQKLEDDRTRACASRRQLPFPPIHVSGQSWDFGERRAAARGVHPQSHDRSHSPSADPTLGPGVRTRHLSTTSCSTTGRTGAGPGSCRSGLPWPSSTSSSTVPSAAKPVPRRALTDKCLCRMGWSRWDPACRVSIVAGACHRGQSDDGMTCRHHG